MKIKKKNNFPIHSTPKGSGLSWEFSVKVSKNLVDALLMEFVKNMKIIKTKIHNEKKNII